MVKISKKERAAIFYATLWLELNAEHQEFKEIADQMLEHRDTLLPLLIRLGSLLPGTTRLTTVSQSRSDSLRTGPFDIQPDIRLRQDELCQE
jgi:hypothetical protein